MADELPDDAPKDIKKSLNIWQWSVRILLLSTLSFMILWVKEVADGTGNKVLYQQVNDLKKQIVEKNIILREYERSFRDKDSINQAKIDECVDLRRQENNECNDMILRMLNIQQGKKQTIKITPKK